MKVKFLQDHTTKEAKPRTFKKDQSVDFYAEYSGQDVPAMAGTEDKDADRLARARAEASAKHFIDRGLAVPDDEQTEGMDRDRKEAERLRSLEARRARGPVQPTPEAAQRQAAAERGEFPGDDEGKLERSTPHPATNPQKAQDQPKADQPKADQPRVQAKDQPKK